MYNPGESIWKINLMKAGSSTGRINTVSQKYSEEIQTPEFGYGLEGILRKRKDDLYGILNGVDYQDWDPAHDRHLAASYDSRDLSGKKQCKSDLLKEFKLPAALENVPLLAVISRLADQKGFDLLADIVDDLLALDVGSSSSARGRNITSFHGESPEISSEGGIRIAYDDRLAHRSKRAIFLMPSSMSPVVSIRSQPEYGPFRGPAPAARGYHRLTIRDRPRKRFQI
jgi:starch synthase